LSRTCSSGRARVISLIADRRSSMTYKQKFIVTYIESLLMYKSQDIEAKWGGGGKSLKKILNVHLQQQTCLNETIQKDGFNMTQHMPENCIKDYPL
jgi:hypothetical protein